MKIDHFIYDSPANPWLGGGGAYRAMEINRRIGSRHDITLYAGSIPRKLRPESPPHIKVRYLGSAWSYPLSRLSFVVCAHLRILFSRADLIVNDLSIFSPIFSFALSRRKQVFVFHHVLGDQIKKKFPLLWPLFAGIERSFIRHCNPLITVSPSVTATLQRSPHAHHAHSITLIPNGIDESLLSTPFENGTYLLFLGRFDYFMKGLDRLLRAFAHVRKHHPDLRLVLAGRPSQNGMQMIHDDIAALHLKTSVEIKTNLPDAHKGALIAGALFLLQPSRFEGWGITAIEAAACGKCVIGTRIDGLQDAIQDGKTGYLIDPADDSALSSKILELLAVPQRYLAMQTACRQWAGQFVWDRISAQQEKLYCTLTGQSETCSAN